MEPRSQDEGGRIESDIQELEDEETEAADVDAELEELHNSLKEVIKDPSVKPKLQCLMVDPSFSMVTVQSEDSGIVWETTSSRCSTPWASEASSPSDVHSLEGSGTQGNVVIIMDEDKIKRRRKTGSRGKLGDRFRRPGSRLSGPAIGEERPAMVEVSVPNIRSEDSQDNQLAESKVNKDQELFNLISEGFEILNIVVPSKLPTLDEEDSTDLIDNLSYLEDTPKIKSKCKQPESAAVIASSEDLDMESEETKDQSQIDSSQTTADGQSKKDETDMDYLEKFTLLDQHATGDESEKLEAREEVQPEEPQVPQEEQKVDDALDEDSFVIVSDVEIASEHLDEVFYGVGCYAEPRLLNLPNEEKEHSIRESFRVKSRDSTLFGSQEPVLTPIFLSPGPPKIIDQDLLDEPRAMSFHYSDLYEDAVGEKKKEEDISDVESVISEKSFKRRFSDSDDGDGYLEKFLLKDDTPVVEDATEVNHTDCERTIWPQNKFEMTGCLTRVKEENEPQEEDENLDQTKLEGKNDIIKGQVEPLESSKVCEDCGDVNTGCAKGERASEVLEHCESNDEAKACSITGKCVSDSGDCGTKTGCVIGKVFETVNQEINKLVLIDDGKQSEESKHADIQVPEGVVEDKIAKQKDEPRDEVIPALQTNDGTEMASEIASELAIQNSVKKMAEGTDGTVEIKETVCITKEEVSGKQEQQQHESMVHKNTEPILVENVVVKDASVPITVSENTIQTVPQEKVGRKEFPVDETEFTMETPVSEKVEKKTIFSAREEKVPEPKCQVEVTAALLESKPEVLESGEIPAVTDEEMKVTAGLSRVPESERQEQVTAKPIVLDMKDIVTADRKAKDTEVETVSEQRTLEERRSIVTRETEEEVNEIKSEVTEKTNQEGEGMKCTVPPMVGMAPAGNTVTESTEILHSSSAVGSLNNTSPPDLTAKQHGVIEQVGKMERYTGLKSEIPQAEDNQILESRGESRESEPEPVSNDTCQVVSPVTLPEVSEVKGDASPAVELPKVLNDEDKTQEEEHEDKLFSDTHNIAEKELPEAVSIMPSVEAQSSSNVSEAPLMSTERTHKEEDKEVGAVGVDGTPTKSSSGVLQPVSSVVTTEPDHVSAMTAPEVEGKNEFKSKKVLLKDTHKENLWKTLEPTSPSPSVEIQDLTSTRVSPLDLVKHELGDGDFDVDGKTKSDGGLFSTLRSFSPHEDLSGFGQDTGDLHKEVSEELDYEMVTEQEARQSEKALTPDEKEYQKLDYIQDQAPEHMVEEGYEFIEDLDGAPISELGQVMVAAEIQPMDAFCLVCRCPALMSDGGHENHEVSTLDKAFENLKDQLSNWISVLQERSENIEDMVSELEVAYNSVEEHCKSTEETVEEQNKEMLKLVMEQYSEMSQTLEDEKKTKLEQLYDQIVSFQENIDLAKETMEKTEREIEETDLSTFMSSYKDVDARLKTTLDSTMSLELGPRGLLVFEDYAKGTTGNGKRNRQVIPVPQQPHLQPQEPNSATSTSVTVYWTVNEGDIIDCFQVYCMEEPQGAVSEEYRVTVKESYCNLEELEADKCYQVWVMAVNYTGCSLPSARLAFRTAPSVPVINPEACTVLWDSAVLRWTSALPSGAESFTLEYCRQYALEGEGLRSVSEIKGSEHKVFLQPNENFLFYIKSVNSAGASEQSEAALISTRATRFHLLTETANSVLKVSEDKNSVQYPEETYSEISSLIEYPAVLGELLPRVGYHYWETEVTACKAYRIGVAYQSAPRDSTVGDNSASWCLHCVPTSISCRFEMLHDSVESDIFVMDVPSRIGTLLDFAQGRLVFFDGQSGQRLGSFRHHFSEPSHPVFVLESPGSLELRMPMEVPEIAKHW